MGAPEETKVQSQEAPTDAAVVSEKFADETLRIVEKYGDDFGPLTTEKEKKLRKKLYLHVMGLLSAINLLLFVSPADLDFIFPANQPRSINQRLVMPPFLDCSRKRVSARLSIITLEHSSMSVSCSCSLSQHAALWM